jgi:N-acetylmuramoyl-L-alanine amidase
VKFGIDPGHGHSNRTPGLFDPGAVNQAFHEADIVLTYAQALKLEAISRGWETFLTRTDNTIAAPLNRRVRRALDAGCNVLVSLHCNASALSGARGTETLYDAAYPLANRVQKGLVKTLGLLDRGVKHRDDLAILKFKESVLVELGFISNAYDLATMMQPDMPTKVAAAICDAIQPLEV